MAVVSAAVDAGASVAETWAAASSAGALVRAALAGSSPAPTSDAARLLEPAGALVRAALLGSASALAPTSAAVRLVLVFRAMPQRPGNVGGEPVAKNRWSQTAARLRGFDVM